MLKAPSDRAGTAAVFQLPEVRPGPTTCGEPPEHFRVARFM